MRKSKLLKSTLLIFTISFLSGCGNDKVTYKVIFDYPNISTQEVLDGNKAIKPDIVPKKDDYKEMEYIFNGWYFEGKYWDFDNEVHSDMTLYPTFSPRKKQYTVRFISDDQVLQTTKYYGGEMPSYNGNEPTKQSDEGYYIFEGWDHEITAASKNEDYIAVFSFHEDGIDFLNMENDFYSYRDPVKQYLETKDANVHNFCDSIDAKKAIEIKWVNTLKNINSQIFEYSINENFEGSTKINLDKDARSVKLFNLLKDTTYFVRITSKGNKETIKTSSFKTTSLGPRVMNIDGVCNVRDVGGYLTSSGKKTLQNNVIRGGALVLPSDLAYSNEITDTGIKFMSEELHIKTEFDLRTDTENRIPGRTDSIIPGANLKYFGVSGYTDAFILKAKYKTLFQEFAKPSNYPIYVHCTGGADRTGTVCFLYNALLGVSYEDLIHDYEMTSFSMYGERNSRPGTAFNMSGFLEQLALYEGESWQEKVENYLLDIGVTLEEIESIKSIAFSE